MLIFFGPSCSGKSTVAGIIGRETGAAVRAGKDYLRLSQSEPEAREIFEAQLREAAKDEGLSSRAMIYLVTSLKSAGAAIPEPPNVLKVKFFADIQVLRGRFNDRLKGRMEPPIDAMLQRQVQDIQNEAGDMQVDTTFKSPHDIARQIVNRTLIVKQPLS